MPTFSSFQFAVDSAISSSTSRLSRPAQVAKVVLVTQLAIGYSLNLGESRHVAKTCDGIDCAPGCLMGSDIYYLVLRVSSLQLRLRPTPIVGNLPCVDQPWFS